MKLETQEITRQEIKKEFQLERMILFSDAVFAIVITLMAIEIRLPEIEGKYDESTFIAAIKHLIPTIFAYIISFFFIGLMWYNHLKMFSLLKDYNKGLIIRNLIFLFFIGLFPFGASLVVSGKATLLPPLIYFIIIILCMSSQLLLQDYILNRAKDITINIDTVALKAGLKRKILTLTSMIIISVLAYITYCIIPNVEDKEYAFLWMFIFMIVAYRINNKSKEKLTTEKIKAKH